MRSRNSVELHYTKPEDVPCAISCSIHPWMRGFIVVRANPYMAKTDADGRFTIKNLPVGRHTFQLWHERVDYLRNVRLGSVMTDAKGQCVIDIGEGKNTLPEVRLDALLFSEKSSD